MTEKNHKFLDISYVVLFQENSVSVLCVRSYGVMMRHIFLTISQKCLKDTDSWQNNITIKYDGWGENKTKQNKKAKTVAGELEDLSSACDKLYYQRAELPSGFTSLKHKIKHLIKWSPRPFPALKSRHNLNLNWEGDMVLNEELYRD